MPVQEQGAQPVEGLVNTYPFVCLLHLLYGSLFLYS